MSGITARHYFDDLPHKENVTAGQAAAIMARHDGYGKRKSPTCYMVQLPDSKRWRRVYSCCYSNVATCYVVQGRDWIVIVF